MIWCLFSNLSGISRITDEKLTCHLERRHSHASDENRRTKSKKSFAR